MIWHPSTTDLALVKTRDLPGWKQYLVERHLRRCVACSEEAHAYAELSGELGRLEQGTQEEPPWLAARILAAASELEAGRALEAGRIWAPAAALVLLVLLALLLVGPGAPVPGGLEYQASATPQAVVGEMIGPEGRHRVVLYTGTQGGPVEVSTGAGGVGITRADPRTGAVIITRIALGE